MSHFAVAVFTEPGGKTVEELLAPYNENTVVPRYVKHTKAELIEKGKREIYDYATTGCYAQWKADPAAYESGVSNENHLNYLKNEFPYKLGWTNEEIYKDQIRYYDDDEVGNNGEVYSTYNPLSKWDWYQIGGRYSGMISLKNGSHGTVGQRSWTNKDTDIPKNKVDAAKVRDIDFAPDSKEYQRAIVEWELIVEGRPPLNEEEENILKHQFYKTEYYTERYKDKETYGNVCAQFLTYAVVMPNGKWYQKGEMGWWGISSEVHDESLDWDLNYTQRFIDTANPEWTLTVVDCHI